MSKLALNTSITSSYTKLDTTSMHTNTVVTMKVHSRHYQTIFLHSVHLHSVGHKYKLGGVHT